MTVIKNCPNCGGEHWGSTQCPFLPEELAKKPEPWPKPASGRSSLEALAQRLHDFRTKETNAGRLTRYQKDFLGDVLIELEAALARVEQETAHETRIPAATLRNAQVLLNRLRGENADVLRRLLDDVTEAVCSRPTPQEARLDLEAIKKRLQTVCHGLNWTAVLMLTNEVERLRASPGAGEARLRWRVVDVNGQDVTLATEGFEWPAIGDVLVRAGLVPGEKEQP